MKILLPVDGSAYTRHMLSFLGEHMDSFGSANTFTVLHAVPAVTARAAAALGKALVDSYYEECAHAVLEPVRALLTHQGVKAEFVHRIGDPASQIAAYAQAGRFDLLIMGSHGEGALKNLLLGSVTTKVMARCSIPVLLVRSDEIQPSMANASELSSTCA